MAPSLTTWLSCEARGQQRRPRRRPWPLCLNSGRVIEPQLLETAGCGLLSGGCLDVRKTGGVCYQVVERASMWCAKISSPLKLTPLANPDSRILPYNPTNAACSTPSRCLRSTLAVQGCSDSRRLDCALARRGCSINTQATTSPQPWRGLFPPL